MRFRQLAGIPLVLLATACSGTTASPLTAAPPSASSAATSRSAAASPAQVQTIAVKLTDALQIEPAQMSVKAGEPVKFVVSNSGATDHEFFLGDAAAQDAHEQEMMSMGGMMHDDANGISVKPGETKELTFTFPSAGAFIAGCHVNSHYATGMKASIAAAQ